MVWTSIGSITLTEEWQSFPQAVLGSDTLRLIHSTAYPGETFNSCWLTRFFPIPAPGGRLVPWRRVYASAEPTLLYLPIPEALKAQNAAVYTVQAKWRLPYYPTPWIIEIEALY
jgi:hypothetical protein